MFVSGLSQQILAPPPPPIGSSPEILELHRILRETDCSMRHEHDLPLWTAHPSKIYTVNSFYQSFPWPSMVDTRFKQAIRLNMPPSSFTFAWSLIWEGLPTGDIIQRRFPTWNIEYECKRCSSGIPETSQHLFISCPVSAITWRLIESRLNIMIGDAVKWWTNAQTISSSPTSVSLLIVIISLRSI